MVKAILEGRKTMTRRIVKPKHDWYMEEGMSWPMYEAYVFADDVHVNCPYGQPGDRLWVRETFAKTYVSDEEGEFIVYKADNDDWAATWKPSIYMPKSAARLWLEIVDVSVERLNDISYIDAISEGFKSKDKFAGYWELLHGHFSFILDPWVWVIEFRRNEK